MNIDNLQNLNTPHPDALQSFPWCPTGDKVVVLRVSETKSQSGKLYIPEVHNQNVNLAWVWAVGPKVADALIRPGAMVALEKYDGRKVTVDGVEYISLPEDEIQMVHQQIGQ